MAIDDNSAVSVLLARYVQAIEMRDVEQKIIADANTRLAQYAGKITNFRSAFAAFGFDLSDKEVWAQVREQIGNPAYVQALRDGKAAAGGATFTTATQTTGDTNYITTITTNLVPVEPLTKGSEQGAGAGGTVVTGAAGTDKRNDVTTQTDLTTANGSEQEDDGADDDVADDVAPEIAETVTPKVRDAVLDRLRLAGSSGMKATELRQYYENAFSTKLHEKTIGMTLYRLSKDAVVRREGRTWFSVPLKGETKNPGGGTPGLIETHK